MSFSLRKVLYAVAMALGLQSCSQAVVESPALQGEGRSIRVYSVNDDTKSVFGDKEAGAYTTLWTASRKVGFSVNGSAMATATPQLIAGGKDASFDVTLSASQSSGTLYGCSPVRSAATGGFDSITSVTIPAQQVPLAGSCDESAQLLLGSCALDASSELAMKFHHISAYGRLTVKGLSGNIASVYVTFPQAVAGEHLNVDLSDYSISGMAERTIWLDGSNAQNGMFWFGIAPTGTLNAGSLSVRVMMSDGKSYTKSIDLSAKSIAFQKGRVTSFAVDMSSVAAEYIFRRTDVIESGKKYLLVAGDAAMTVSSGKSYGYPGVTAVHPSSGIVTMPDLNSALTFTASGTGYTIKTSFGAYLYQTAEYNSFNWDTTASSGRIWRVSIASNGDATITNVDKNKYIQLRTGYSSFGSYASKQSDGVLPKLYVLDEGDRFYAGDISGATTPTPSLPPVAEGEPVLGLGWLELPAQSAANSHFHYIPHYATMNGSRARNYTCLYDDSMLTSYWVAYPLCSAHIGSGRVESWGFDSAISSSLQPDVRSGYGASISTVNYPSNLYARGHQIPNADRNAVSAMQAQTYYSTNIIPEIQNGFNGGIWGNLEDAVRRKVPSGDTLYVVTGCTFQKVGSHESIRHITNKNDGKSLPVPNYIWKVLLKVRRTAGAVTSASAVGVWLPHEDLQGESYTKYVVSVDQIEEWTGFDFFVNVPESLQSGAETNSNWNSF